MSENENDASQVKNEQKGKRPRKAKVNIEEIIRKTPALMFDEFDEKEMKGPEWEDSLGYRRKSDLIINATLKFLQSQRRFLEYRPVLLQRYITLLRVLGENVLRINEKEPGFVDQLKEKLEQYNIPLSRREAATFQDVNVPWKDLLQIAQQSPSLSLTDEFLAKLSNISEDESSAKKDKMDLQETLIENTSSGKENE